MLLPVLKQIQFHPDHRPQPLRERDVSPSSAVVGLANTKELGLDPAKVDVNAMQDLEWVKGFVLAIRTIRGEMDIAPSKPLPVLLKNASIEDIRRLEENAMFLYSIAKLETVTALNEDDNGSSVGSNGGADDSTAKIYFSLILLIFFNLPRELVMIAL